MAMRAFLALFLSFEVASAFSVKKTNTTKIEYASHVDGSRQGVFMITSGLSSFAELCLTVENGLTDSVGSNVVLVPCAAAIAAGDGREMFSLQEDGHLLSAAGNLCVSLSNGDEETGSLVLAQCDVADDVFELEGSGQIKYGKNGQNCVSQRGTAAGQVNLALGAAVSATSNVPSHGPIQAVNGMGSYWASKLGFTGPVEFVVELGNTASLDAAEITWEFPAKSFSVLIENAGAWSEVYATTVNSLYKTHIPLGSSVASKVKIVMLESHPLHGVLNGHALYGISSLELKANGLRTVVEDCATAAKTADCRDKYFLSYVGESDPFPAKAPQGESPGLEAAQTSLAATTAELAEAVSKLESCGEAKSFAAKSIQRTMIASRSEQSGELSSLHAASVPALLKEARAVIVLLRSALM